jgi:hypothetical protein
MVSVLVVHATAAEPVTVLLLIVSIYVLLILSSTSTCWFVFRPALAIIRVTALVTYTSPQGGQWRVRKPLMASLVQRNTLGPCPQVLCPAPYQYLKSFCSCHRAFC